MYEQLNPASNQAALWQASGIGDYENVGDWSWMFDPGAFSWLAPQDSTPQPAFGLQGLGCNCGGACGGCGDHKHGMGLFDSMDFSTWGWQEWALVGLGVWGTMRIVGDVKGAGRKLRRRRA